MPRWARTAFRYFSAACWACRPTTASANSGSGAIFATATASRSALAAITRARARPSRLGKDPSLAQRLVEHRARHVAPLLDVRLRDHDDVGRQAQGREQALQSDDLAVLVLDPRLDHEQVDVAVGPGLAAGVRAEEDHAGAGNGGGDPPRAFVDEVRVDHLRATLSQERAQLGEHRVRAVEHVAVGVAAELVAAGVGLALAAAVELPCVARAVVAVAVELDGQA